MALEAAKQIKKFISAFLGLSAVAVSSANNVNITTAITTLLTTAGDGGGSVPLQQGSSSQMGLITSSNNVVKVWDNTTHLPISVGGNEVYGRLSFSTPNYLVSFFTDVAGTETAATLNQSVELAIPYKFDFANLPQDSLILYQDLAPGDGGTGIGGIAANETLTVTGNNTFSNLSQVPVNALTAKMTVNGQTLYAGLHFTITGQAISISGGQATAIGYTIATTDSCVMEYRY